MITEHTTLLDYSAVDAAGLDDWVLILQALRASYHPADFAAELRFVNRSGEAAEQADHHPDLTLKYGLVAITLSSHDVGGVTGRDLDLARTITTIAHELGLEADPRTPSGLGLALDTHASIECVPSGGRHQTGRQGWRCRARRR